MSMFARIVSAIFGGAANAAPASAPPAGAGTLSGAGPASSIPAGVPPPSPTQLS